MTTWHPTTGLNVSNLSMKTSKARQNKAFRPSRLTLAMMGCLCLSATQTFAAPTILNDVYTLQTTNQSMWGSGGQSSWAYDTGFQGAQWGTYAGSAPAGGGINAITGSQNVLLFPALPGTPDVHVPAVVTPGFCVWGGACVPDVEITPAFTIPGIPATPAVYGDTRTGAAVSVSSSGRVGVDVTAQAQGGGISVVLPVTTALSIGDTVNGQFHVGGTSSFGAGSTITSTAPSFKAGVYGVINLDNSLNLEGCFIGAGCDNTTVNLNVDPGQFSLVGLDTTKTKPVSVFGLPVPIKFDKEYQIREGQPPCQGPATADGVEPVCDVSPLAMPLLAVIKPTSLQDFTGGSFSGDVLSIANNTPVLRVTADLTGILQAALDFPADVLNPSLNLTVATISGSLLDVQAGVTLGMEQKFSLAPSLQVTLLFDKPIEEYDPTTQQWVDEGTDVTIDLAAGADLRFVGDAGVLVSRTYSMKDATNFTSNTSLSIDPTLPIKALCIDIELKLGLGGTGQQCAFQKEFKTTDLVDISAYSNRFSLQGFNTAQFGGVDSTDPYVPSTPDIPPLFDPTTPFAFFEPSNPVPEPSSIWLTALALIGLVSVSKRKQGKAICASV